MATNIVTPAFNPTNGIQDIEMEDELAATQPLDAPSTQVEHWQSIDSGAWGVLVPVDKKSPVIRLVNPIIYLGRTLWQGLPPGQSVQIIHPGISKKHCSLHWNGRDDGDYRVYVYDQCSTNGTYIDNIKLADAQPIPNQDRLPGEGWLVSGNIISFGTSREALPPNGSQDTRYIYKHLASAMRVSRTMDMIE
ncbi:hypothetical protein BC629DRAFT_1501494 [Irpex lacteus]|nr:hypothetical protein BC629DRAFT_1501494 [Irpex lacteus]